MSKKQPKVYLAGPYTTGDVAINVRRALNGANWLRDHGFAPFVPHLTHFWHMIYPRSYEDWLDLDNQFLPLCDAVLRIPGESSGADKEVALAESMNIPVFYTCPDLLEHFNERS